MPPSQQVSSTGHDDVLRRAGDASVLILTSLAEAQNTAMR